MNDYWCKGPNSFINNLFGILVKFRENHIGFIGDIKKMYNSVRIGELDQHCHRFLWRCMETYRKPDIHVLTAVTMGDRPSVTVEKVALRKTAEMSEAEYPIEAKIIKESSYVDDIADCASDIETAETITQNISKILALGNFIMKD